GVAADAKHVAVVALVAVVRARAQPAREVARLEDVVARRVHRAILYLPDASSSLRPGRARGARATAEGAGPRGRLPARGHQRRRAGWGRGAPARLARARPSRLHALDGSPWPQAFAARGTVARDGARALGGHGLRPRARRSLGQP